MCQTLGFPPTSKCLNDGGPECKEICEAIRTHSGAPEAGVRTFSRAQILNWIVGGMDSHAKNFSLLISAGGRARLAPLQDMASALPYDFQLQRFEMAFKIGGRHRNRANPFPAMVQVRRRSVASDRRGAETRRKHGRIPGGISSGNRRRDARRPRPPDPEAHGGRAELARRTLRSRSRDDARFL